MYPEIGGAPKAAAFSSNGGGDGEVLRASPFTFPAAAEGIHHSLLQV